MKIDASRKLELKGHAGSIYTLEHAADPACFFSGSSDKYVALWNLRTGMQENFAAQFPASIYSLCFVKEQNMLLVGTSAGSIHVLDLTKKQELKILQHHTEPVFDLRYSLQHGTFYSVGADGNFAVGDLSGWTTQRIRKVGNGKIRTMDLFEPRDLLALGSADGSIHLFRLSDLSRIHSFPAHEMGVNKLKFDPSGNYLFSGGKDAHLKKWNTADFQITNSVAAHNFAIYGIAFHPTLPLFATASRDKTIKIWNPETMDVLVRLEKELMNGHGHSVNTVLWSSYQNMLVTGSDDRSILGWDIHC